MGHSILIVDDETSILSALKGALEDEGYLVSTCSSGEQALSYLEKQTPDAILLDIWMPGLDGLETLRRIKDAWPQTVVIMMSGHGTIETAVRSTKLGAYDFVEKPLSLEKILVLLKNAQTTHELAIENSALRKQLSRTKSLIGKSAAIEQIREMIRRVAPTTGSVLITGENGTGKEVVAQNIHALSPRYNKPFIEVNCAAIPEELIESELFGHEKGSFTGANQQRRGKFDLAHGGTLFLDEIGDMSLKTQAKILRILQDQKFTRVGGSQSFIVDVRIIAATNKNLKSEIQKGSFREDLYHRLNVIPFQISPLRERKEDIPLLVEHFLQTFCDSHGRPVLKFSGEAIRVISSYSWPGNVRELKNLIERIVILVGESEAKKPITAALILQHLNEEPQSPTLSANDDKTLSGLALGSAARNLKDARHEFEREFILKTLKENDWNISKTATILGVERSHLHRKIKSYGIDPES
jgi:two-component system nitrogen regulation response regulator NtrX